MSYTTRVSGEFTIEPPITWEEIKDSDFQHSHQADSSSVATWRAPRIDLDLIVDMIETDIEGGVAYRYSGTKLRMRQIDEYRADGLPGQLDKVLAMFDGDHVYEGRLEAEGEGGGWGPDVWRLEVVEGKAVKTSAMMLYPDDLKAERTEYAAGLLRLIANEVEALPQDYELDPGRGDVKALLRLKADELDAGEGPVTV